MSTSYQNRAAKQFAYPHTLWGWLSRTWKTWTFCAGAGAHAQSPWIVIRIDRPKFTNNKCLVFILFLQETNENYAIRGYNIKNECNVSRRINWELCPKILIWALCCRIFPRLLQLLDFAKLCESAYANRPSFRGLQSTLARNLWSRAYFDFREPCM